MSKHLYFDARRLGLGASTALGLGLASLGGVGIAAAAAPVSAAPSVSTTVANNTLTITGTNGPDVVALRPDATDPSTLVVALGATGSVERRFDSRTFTSISVFLRGGNDQFTEQPGVFADKALMVDGGSGADQITGGSGNDVIVGSSGNDTLDGGAGDDLIVAGRGNDTVAGDAGHDTALLGSGRDHFSWDPGDGSDVVDGQGGVDTLDFIGSNGAETMSLSPNGPGATFLRDLGGIRMDLTHIEALHLDALGGADNVTVGDMTGTSFRRADIDLSNAGSGDGAADVVTVSGSPRADRARVAASGTRADVTGLRTETHITGADTMDRLQVNTMGGNDRVAVRRAAEAQLGVAVDLGANQP